MTFYVFCSRAKGTLSLFTFYGCSYSHLFWNKDLGPCGEGENAQCLIGPLMKEKRSVPWNWRKFAEFQRKQWKYFLSSSWQMQPSLLFMSCTQPCSSVNKACGCWFISGRYKRTIFAQILSLPALCPPGEASQEALLHWLSLWTDPGWSLWRRRRRATGRSPRPSCPGLASTQTCPEYLNMTWGGMRDRHSCDC